MMKVIKNKESKELPQSGAQGDPTANGVSRSWNGKSTLAETKKI
jgi:hypothetical protein